MPILQEPDYIPPFLFRNKHVNTIYGNKMRKEAKITYSRRRIDTPDGDFIDLDFSGEKGDATFILCHGLEGHSQRKYMKGMAKILNDKKWDAVAFNYRSCSGEMNRKRKYYHAGSTYDLDTVVNYLEKDLSYKQIGIIGFSLGGNLVLKYLGEKSDKISPAVKVSVAVSSVVDMESTAQEGARLRNFIYTQRLLKMLEQKIVDKEKLMPGFISLKNLKRIKSGIDYDEYYTAPLHGFKNAKDYWDNASALPYLKNIMIPTLIINALDDPMLGKPSYPFKEAEQNSHLYLLAPEFGGHLGFVIEPGIERYWHEERTVDFLRRFI